MKRSIETPSVRHGTQRSLRDRQTMIWRTVGLRTDMDRSVRLVARPQREKGSLLWLLFDGTGRTLSLYNPAKGDFGPAFAPGSRNVLSSGAAKVYLGECAVIAAGPNSPEVTLLLTVGFGPPVIGEDYPVAVGATSDDGQIQDFDRGGTVTIVPGHK